MNLLLSQSQWPRIARDVAIVAAPDSPITLDDVKDAYGLSDSDIKALAGTPAFAAMLERELDAVRKAGDRAGAKYRALSLSQALSEKLFADAAAGAASTGESLKLLELLLRASGLMEPERPAQVAVQTNIDMGRLLPKLPKLAHCVPVEE